MLKVSITISDDKYFISPWLPKEITQCQSSHIHRVSQRMLTATTAKYILGLHEEAQEMCLDYFLRRSLKIIDRHFK